MCWRACSPMAKPRPGGRRRETVLREARDAEERGKAITGDIRCLGAERSEVRVAKSGIPLRVRERRAGVRASIGAGKRVTSVEQREAGRWMWSCLWRTKYILASAQLELNEGKLPDEFMNIRTRLRLTVCMRMARVTERSRRYVGSLSQKVRTSRIHSSPRWTTNWRAGCGKSARPVRREGEAERPLPTPMDW